MKFPGYSRVLRVYPIWFLISTVILTFIVGLGFHFPEAILLITVVFLVKDILFDLKIIRIHHPRVYWIEHAPFVLLVCILGILGFSGMKYFEGYVNFMTIPVAFTSFILNFYKDLRENPTVYLKTPNI